MMTHFELFLLAGSLLISLSMIPLYHLCAPEPKPYARVNLKVINNEFLAVALHAKLSKREKAAMVSALINTIDEGINMLAGDYMLFTDNRTFGQEPDVTGKLRRYVMERVTHWGKPRL